MNIFRKYTRKSLGANRSRTLVTIIGIVLSMSLLTAVIEGAYSGVQFMTNTEIADSGKWHVYLSDMDETKLGKLEKDDLVDEIYSWKSAGAADTGSKDSYSKYLFINSITEEFYDMVAVNLSEGRLPENDSEIIIPHNMPRILDGTEIKVGDIINISVGERVSQSGESLGLKEYREGETLTGKQQKTYTVVGVYLRLNQAIISYETPGYVGLTYGTEGRITGSFATLKNTSKAYNFSATRSDSRDPAYISTCKLHTDLLNYTGNVRNSRVQTMIYGFAAILVIMVSFGSVSLIYNSFSISLAERTKQFGILKSVGATKKQLRSSVLYEALVLGGIGIPIGMIVGCAGIGTTLYLLKDQFSYFAPRGGVEMKMVLNPVALLIAALVCLIVIIISAWIPAARAVRIQPIDAIRQNADTKIKAKEVRTSKLVQKLFGFEGTMASKNFKRNAKRYRATVISLFMSVVLFISASSFCSYLTDSVEGIVSNGINADIAYSDYSADPVAPEKFRDVVSGISGIDKLEYSVEIRGNIMASPLILSDEYWSLEPEEYREESKKLKEMQVYLQIAFVDDDTFKALLKENGLKESDYFNTSAPKAVLYNTAIASTSENGTMSWHKISQFRSSALPFTLTLRNIKDIDGYIMVPDDETGGALYYPEEYYVQVAREHPGDAESYLDKSKAMFAATEKSVYSTELTVAAEVKSTTMLVSDQGAAVIYPYSMLKYVFSDPEAYEKAYQGVTYGINAKDHKAVFAEIQKALKENDISDNYRYLHDIAEQRNSNRMIVTVVNVFSYGFIILISLIALANVFNTISTNILLRKREFAMLRSIGLSQKGFSKMMNYECIIYGARSLMLGLPAAVLMTYMIWRVTGEAFETGFYLPWKGVVIAVSSVFIVVFATMMYATGKIRNENTMDALRNENL